MAEVICSDTPSTADCAKSKGFDLATETREFEAAVTQARRLAEMCGAGYVGRVWENLGWHYEALSPCRRVTISPSTSSGKVDSYRASLHEAGESGTPALFYEHGLARKTPRLALIAALKLARKRLAKYNAIVEGL